MDNEREKERSKGKEGWGEEKQEYYKVRGLGDEKIEKTDGGKEIEYKEIERMDKEVQKKERWQKIINSRYNKWYKCIKEEGMPKYIKGKWNANRVRRLARYRLGNEVEEGRY